jgi:hypothetical protein
MLIKEYRIPMPLTVEEYRIAQLYMVAKFSRERTTKGEGIEILKNEPYEDENGKGQFTHKVIHLGSHLPAWALSLIPNSMLSVEEKSWNAYPYVKTVYTCPFFGERFSIVSETKYVDDDGSSENALNLSAENLAQREVDTIDIVTEDVDPRYYKKEEDPKLYVSEKTGRGKLQAGWHKTHKPVMCIYKVAYVEFRVWGLQTKSEQWLHKSMVRDVVLLGHKQAFCWLDEWIGMTLEHIRQYEADTKAYLDKLRSGEISNPNAEKEEQLAKEQQQTGANANSNANPEEKKGWFGW